MVGKRKCDFDTVSCTGCYCYSGTRYNSYSGTCGDTGAYFCFASYRVGGDCNTITYGNSDIDAYGNGYAHTYGNSDTDAYGNGYAHTYGDSDTYTYSYRNANTYSYPYADDNTNSDSNTYS